MSNFGVQAFIRGTTFDAVDSIDFNYVIDVITVGRGSGSKSYDNPQGLTLSAAMFNSAQNGLHAEETMKATISGNTLSWNVPVSTSIVVTGSY